MGLPRARHAGGHRPVPRCGDTGRGRRPLVRRPGPAPLLIVPHANKDVYLDNYAQAHKGARDRTDDWWPAPYWDIDTGFASLLMLLSAVDEGLGACFFGISEDRIDPYREAFGVPEQLRPIGAISIGYPDEPPSDFSGSRKSVDEVVPRGRWSSSG